MITKIRILFVEVEIFIRFINQPASVRRRVCGLCLEVLSAFELRKTNEIPDQLFHCLDCIDADLAKLKPYEFTPSQKAFLQRYGDGLAALCRKPAN